jgi:hypothetical protein
MTQIWALRSRLEKQPTDLRRNSRDLRDGTLADRTSEALETIKEAQAHAQRFDVFWWCAELHRLRGVFLSALGADGTQIEVSFREAIKTAKRQKSISLATRAEISYAEYRAGKA